jgi:ABC-type dipeptide/oligopeptide/nickel transport system permease subunit
MTAVAAGAGVTEARVSGGLWSDALRRLRRNKPALVGLVCIVIFVGVAIFAPLVAPYGEYEGKLGPSNAGPSPEHLFGLDKLGRDMFSRVLYGAQISLQVGVIAVLMALTMGGIIGALAGGLGGKVDSFLMRTTDVLLAIPGILLAIGIIAWLERGMLQLMLAIAVTYVAVFARLLRGSILALRESDYVIAATAVGASKLRLLVRHMLPNALTPLIVQATLILATAIIDIAGLGFLGLGPPDPRTPEWGTMLVDARRFLATAPHIVFFVGGAIVVSAIGFNLLGDGLRESLDPRLKR